MVQSASKDLGKTQRVSSVHVLKVFHLKAETREAGHVTPIVDNRPSLLH